MPFGTSPAGGRFSRLLPRVRVLPASSAQFCPTFVGFRRAARVGSARVAGYVLVRSSNRMPRGQLRFTAGRNSPPLLDSARTGFSSILTAGLHISRADRARTQPEEPVNPASNEHRKRHSSEGPGQPTWPDLCPVAWVYLWIGGRKPRLPPADPVLSRNCYLYTTESAQFYRLLFTRFTPRLANSDAP